MNKKCKVCGKEKMKVQIMLELCPDEAWSDPKIVHKGQDSLSTDQTNAILEAVAKLEQMDVSD